ncbi:MAG: LLM class flavin-dependent oxidoreductase [Acidimicrobiales bacterium]
MNVGLFVFCSVPMADAGPADPQPTARRASNELIWDTTERIVDLGVLADRVGFDYFFFTEHHFQHEGYEVIPNGLMTGLVLAERTKRIKIGALVHVIPQWHPLRFAEDFATLHNFSGGRAVLSVGRGTVPREAIPLGAVIGSSDDPEMRAKNDTTNREMFAEAVEVIDLALNNERFRFHGAHYEFPPPGIPDRGGTVEELTLTPRPLYPYEQWQTITSPPTVESVARRGVGGVWWNQSAEHLADQWQQFEAIWQDEHGEQLAPGDKRMLVLNARVASTRAEAIAAARPCWDEHWKFLAPYGRAKGFIGPDGGVPPDGWVPPLEVAMEQGLALVGTPADVTAGINKATAGAEAATVTIFPICLGDSYDKYEEQAKMLAEEVLVNFR